MVSPGKDFESKPILGKKPKTKEFRLGFEPVHNLKIGLKPPSGGNSLNHKSKAENLDLKSKFEKLFSSPESNSGRYVEELTPENSN